MFKRKIISSPEDLITQLEYLKQQNKKKAEIALSKEEKNFLEERGYVVKPLLYEIKTRRFDNVKKREALFRELHDMCKRNKMLETRRLKKGELKLLDSEGIKYRISRYEVYL